MWGDAAERSGTGCYICGHPRDHEGLPHGVITRQQADLIRAKAELDALHFAGKASLDAILRRLARTDRRVRELEQENHA